MKALRSPTKPTSPNNNTSSSPNSKLSLDFHNTPQKLPLTPNSKLHSTQNCTALLLPSQLLDPTHNSSSSLHTPVFEHSTAPIVDLEIEQSDSGSGHSPPQALAGVDSELDPIWERIGDLSEMASRETAKMNNSSSVPKLTATPEDQEAKSPQLPSPPPSTSNKAQNENPQHSSSSSEPRKKKAHKTKSPEQMLSDKTEKVNTNQTQKQQNSIPPSELSTSLIQNRRSPRLHALQNIPGTMVSQKPGKNHKSTSNAQEPKGSILTAFVSISGPKKQKLARAPPQASISSNPSNESTEVEHSANGRIINGDVEHSTSNPSPQIPEKTKTVQKLRIFAVQHGFLHFWIPCLESLTP
jgi:hypothetical protein